MFAPTYLQHRNGNDAYIKIEVCLLAICVRFLISCCMEPNENYRKEDLFLLSLNFLHYALRFWNVEFLILGLVGIMSIRKVTVPSHTFN